MALASSSKSELYNYELDNIWVKDISTVGDVVVEVQKLFDYVRNLTEEDVGIAFNGFDDKFSVEDNKVSMSMKIIQECSKRIMERNIEEIFSDTGIELSDTYLSMSGGFGLNCITNSHLMKKYNFKGFLASPCINDGGMSLGIALFAFYNRLKGEPFEFKLESAYYGEYDDDFGRVLEKYGDYIRSVREFCPHVAVNDITSAPIAWFNGNSEIGPRALGNRSILADPRSHKVKERLNEIKLRQWWRPVAPLVIEDEVCNWFERAYSSPYMLHTFDFIKNKCEYVPAIAHIDNSARIQTLNRKDNAMLFSVLEALCFWRQHLLNDVEFSN
jgi:predicted NodU family carbamoyl transferase